MSMPVKNAVLYTQVSKRRQFYFYEKMAAVQNIQQYIRVSDLSTRAACRVANLHHKQFITWKRDYMHAVEK